MTDLDPERIDAQFREAERRIKRRSWTSMAPLAVIPALVGAFVMLQVEQAPVNLPPPAPEPSPGFAEAIKARDARIAELSERNDALLAEMSAAAAEAEPRPAALDVARAELAVREAEVDQLEAKVAALTRRLTEQRQSCPDIRTLDPSVLREALEEMGAQ